MGVDFTFCPTVSMKLSIPIMQNNFLLGQYIYPVDFSILINWMSPFPNLGVSGVFCIFISFRIETPVLVNSADPDQMPRFAASDQGLLYLPMSRTFMGC